MKNLNIVDVNKISDDHLRRLKLKAKNGFQMLRFPRAGSTAVKHAFEKSVSPELFTDLECCSFSDLPFSWGQSHNVALGFPPNCKPSSDVYQRVLNHVTTSGGIGTPYPEDGDASREWVRDFNIRADKKPEYADNKLTFQIVRNPYDWITSIYTWDFMKTRERKVIEDFDKFIVYCFHKELIYHGELSDNWVSELTHPFPYPMMKRCFFQGFDDNDNCHVDVYIRYEYLHEGIKTLLALGDHELSVDLNAIQPPRLNGDLLKNMGASNKVTKWSVTNRFNKYCKYFYKSENIIQLVKNAYKWDLENFNYDLSGPGDQFSVLVNVK